MTFSLKQVAERDKLPPQRGLVFLSSAAEQEDQIAEPVRALSSLRTNVGTQRAASLGMPVLIHQYTAEVEAADGTHYRVLAYGEQRQDGMWAGWLTFVPREKDTILRTDQETLQSTEGDLAYWAGGLGPGYIEGALQRATDA